MLKVVAIMFCGIAVGFLLRKRRLRVVPHAVTVLIWLLLFFLGIIGEYIAKIYLETKHRPHYIVNETNDPDAEKVR
jgi:uncharacterized membrane protein YbjE (DUF340 family)